MTYKVTNTVAGVVDHMWPSQSASFDYDPNDRLAVVARSGDDQTFNLDNVGNRRNHVRRGVSYAFTMSPSSNRIDAVSGGANRTYVYDAAGNLIDEAGPGFSRALQYDEFNRTRRVVVGGSVAADYYYNGLNQRVAKVSGNTSTHYVYGPSGELIYESGQHRRRCLVGR